MIATDGITTVDHNDYDLTIYQAAHRLLSKEKIIAIGYPDFSRDRLTDVYPDPVVLDWQDYQGMDEEEVMEVIGGYEQFGIYL